MTTQPKHSPVHPAELSLARQAERPAVRSTSALTAPAEDNVQVRPSPVARLLIPDGEPLPPAGRLVILIPDLETDDTQLARRIWTLASPRGLDVLFLSLCHDADEELRLRRRLATLAAVTRDEGVHVETRLEVDQDWLRAVRSIWHPGDLVVCHAEQSLPAWGVGRQSLGRALVSALNSPVYVLAGFYPEMPVPRPNLFVRLIQWAIPVAIIASFFWIQIRVDQPPKDWARTLLLYLSVIAEFGLIWIWNRFLG